MKNKSSISTYSKITFILSLLLSISYAKENSIKLFIIGASTVHNTTPSEMGWGTALKEYALNPKNIYNLARAGSSSKSYKICNSKPSECYKNRNWENTKNLIKHTDISSGAYLLIQFAHNDEDESRAEVYTVAGRGKSFYQELKVFVDEAKELGVTPILSTPTERMRKRKNQNLEITHRRADGDYGQTVRDLAKDSGVLLIDLQKKTYNEFNKYSDREAIMKKFAFDDTTHFSPQGAKIVASWVKELMCKSRDKKLCSIMQPSSSHTPK
jgi:lysophospholipase L1-like esterase